jgi:hypothetical protein
VRPQSTYNSAFPLLLPVADRRSVDDLALNSQRSSPKSQTQGPVVEQKKSRGLFDRMRSSNRTPDPNPATPSQSYISAGHARRLSKRLQNAPAIRTSSTSSPDQAQRPDWQVAQDPRTFLPSPQERAEEDTGLDPYLIQEPEQPEPRSPRPDQAQPHTIRAVQSELDRDPSGYPANDDSHLQRHSLVQGYQQQLDVPQHNHYQGQNQGQLSPYPDSLGITHDPYSHNIETVSQLSFDTTTEQREDQVSEYSNGNSPTGNPNPQLSEHSSRTAPATRGARPSSQYTMAPAPGTSQQPRRAADPKQAMQGNQGQPDLRDGNYRQPFAGNSTPTTALSTSPLPTAPGPDYRGGPPQREQFGPTAGGERGRSTPPLAGERDVNDAYKEICELQPEKPSRYGIDIF